MKIFYVDVSEPQIDIFSQLQEIAKNKNSEIFFLTSDDNAVKNNLKYPRVIYRTWNYNHFVRRIFNFFRNQKGDIIHFNFELRPFGLYKVGIKLPFLLFLARTTKIKTVVTLHSIYVVKEGDKYTLFEHQDVPIPRFLLKIFVKLFIKSVCTLSDTVIVFAKGGKLGLVEFFGIKQEKIEVAKLAISPYIKTTDPEKKNKFKSQFNNKKIILCFGNLSSRKGLETAIKSMKIISDKLPDHLLVIAGLTTSYNKPYAAKLQKLPKILGVEDKVIFTGFLDNDEVKILFDISEVTLYIYKPSATGTMAIHHAIQNHKAIIASDIDNFNEILGYEDALFIEPDNETQLIDAILKIANNPDLRIQLEQRMKKISGFYSWEKTANSYWKVYEKIGQKNCLPD